jgi:UDP-N-acetylmuramoylalanine--D-glutamate ligase
VDFTNKQILVIGLARSGAACARFLTSRGARVTLNDLADETALGDRVRQMRDLGVRVVLGSHPFDIFEKADMIVLSPGVPHTLPVLQHVRDKNVPIIGEMELAARFIHEPMVAVTGTNGKTTVTTLVGEMLKSSGLRTFVGGNIGNPLIEYVTAGEKADRVVVEVSSFQLDTISSFRPEVSVLLNIAEDHLDRYPDYNAYGKSKARIFENQDESDAAVINGADLFIRRLAREVKARKLFFNGREADEEGIIIHKGSLTARGSGMSGFAVNLSTARLTGRHNQENMAAAALAAFAAGGSLQGIQTALDHFKGLPHRLEYVATVNGVRYFDDSKATNVDAVARALESFDAPMILIMGGRGKGDDYSLLADKVGQGVRRLILMGEMAETIRSALGNACKGGVYMARDMADAVAHAYECAAPGNVTLLSPACSSFDMFRDYAHRGECFCREVRQLAGEA